jgi:hypothetical protein
MRKGNGSGPCGRHGGSQTPRGDLGSGAAHFPDEGFASTILLNCKGTKTGGIRHGRSPSFRSAFDDTLAETLLQLKTGLRIGKNDLGLWLTARRASSARAVGLTNMRTLRHAYSASFSACSAAASCLLGLRALVKAARARQRARLGQVPMADRQPRPPGRKRSGEARGSGR